MTYDEVYSSIGTRLQQGDIAGAFEICGEYERTAPTSRDRGCALWMRAELGVRAGGEPRHIWACIEGAGELLRAYPQDLARVCEIAVDVAGIHGEIQLAKHWASRFARLLRRAPSVRPFLPRVLEVYARVLRSQCRWAAARSTLLTSYRLTRDLSRLPDRTPHLRQIALMIAWCSAELRDVVEASRWYGRAAGPPLSPCWADIRLATKANILLAGGNWRTATKCLAGARDGARDMGGLFVLMVAAKTLRGGGLEWRPTWNRAVSLATATHHQWAIGPLHAALDFGGKEGLAHATLG